MKTGMTNAKEELLGLVDGKAVTYVYIRYAPSYGCTDRIIQGPLTDELLAQLDFNYDSGFGGQELFGHVWFADGTWADRGEYDGSEWWVHVTRPEIPPHETRVEPMFLVTEETSDAIMSALNEPHGLTYEILLWAFERMKKEPKVSVAEAIKYGFDEWVK